MSVAQARLILAQRLVFGDPRAIEASRTVELFGRLKARMARDTGLEVMEIRYEGKRVALEDLGAPALEAILGCLEGLPCVEMDTGETCAWEGPERDLCTFCAEFNRQCISGFDRGMRRSEVSERLVVPATEYEAQRYIDGLRAMRAGGGR